ncbi:MAG: hypothetical protein AAGU05_16680 [Anaerolineaceae bacterium]
MDNWKTKTLIFGGLIGLITGIVASFIMIQQAEKRNVTPAITATDGVKLGLGLLTFMRLLSEITTKD